MTGSGVNLKTVKGLELSHGKTDQKHEAVSMNRYARVMIEDPITKLPSSTN